MKIKTIKNLEYFMEHELLHKISGAFMLLYSIIIGLKTLDNIMQQYGTIICLLEKVICAMFVVEIVLRLFGSGLKFFRNGWNVFDALVIGASIIAESSGIAVVRVLRLLRVSEVLAMSKYFRLIADSILHALPGILHVGALMLFMFYLSSIAAYDLFAKTNPDLFGSFSKSIYTLFLMMIGEGVGDVLTKVMTYHPYSYIFFVIFLAVMTFTVLNLFFGLIVDAIQSVTADQANSDDRFAPIEDRLRKIEDILRKTTKNSSK
ncbi:MAG: ion transporter [Holosporaceae bacterium]|jgi:voltage-gated sodium channel|nr:ion transporter [Holosporaceae bacterium]